MKRFFYIIVFFIGFHFNGFSQIIENESVKLLHFFPNPAVNYINFDVPENSEKELTLQIYNFIGKKVIDIPNLPLHTNLPLTDFYRGIYIFQLRNKIGKIIESGKFQVVK